MAIYMYMYNMYNIDKENSDKMTIYISKFIY